jgi:hypothetical protein
MDGLAIIADRRENHIVVWTMIAAYPPQRGASMKRISNDSLLAIGGGMGIHR